jgi:hypothetical protein
VAEPTKENPLTAAQKLLDRLVTAEALNARYREALEFVAEQLGLVSVGTLPAPMPYKDRQAILESCQRAREALAPDASKEKTDG